MARWRTDFELVNSVSIAFSLCSLVASGAIFATYFCLGLARAPSFRVILLLVCSDMLYALQALFLWTDPDRLYNRGLCVAQAFFSNFSNLAQLGWTSVMALILFLENKHLLLHAELFSRSRCLTYVSLGFVLPLIFSLPPLFGAYSPADNVCWITLDESESLCDPRYFEEFGPYCPAYNQVFVVIVYVLVWGSILANCVLYARIILFRRAHLQAIRSSVESGQSREEVASLHLLVFPLGQLLLWVFPTLHRIIGLAGGADAGEPLLSVLHYASLALSGVVNMFIYGCNPLVRAQLKAFCARRKGGNKPEDQPLIYLPQGPTEDKEYDTD